MSAGGSIGCDLVLTAQLKKLGKILKVIPASCYHGVVGVELFQCVYGCGQMLQSCGLGLFGKTWGDVASRWIDEYDAEYGQRSVENCILVSYLCT